jgi:hypothetical protein
MEGLMPCFSETPVKMKVHLIWKCSYVLLFLASIVMAVFLIEKGQSFGLFFIIFSMVAGFLIKMSLFYVEADDEKIVVYSPPFGMYEIRWAETETVETNGTGYLLRGPDKALGFNTAMGDGSAVQLREFLGKQIEARGIVVKEVKITPRANPVNTMVIPKNGKWGRKGENAPPPGHGRAEGRGRMAVSPLTGQPIIMGGTKGKKPRRNDE